MSLLAAVNRGSIGIPNQPDLVRQLRLLERRPRAGRDWIDLPRGASEDEANAVAGLCWLLTSEQQDEEPAFIIGGALY